MNCEYGCGQKAEYQFKNGKWCCSKHFSKCPSMMKVSDATRKKLSIIRKGHIPWNKYKTNIFSEESLNKMRMNSRRTIKKINIRYPLFSKIEEMRYNPDKNEKEIQVHCKNHKCKNSKEKGGWFTPTSSQITERIRSIEKNNNDGSFFYCCEICKIECPLYNVQPTHLIKEYQIQSGYITEEYYTRGEYNIWREEVLKRANYKCEYCNEKAEHAHHSRPQKLEPFFSLDPDLGIACCEKCHHNKGHINECSYGTLSQLVCI